MNVAQAISIGLFATAAITGATAFFIAETVTATPSTKRLLRAFAVLALLLAIGSVWVGAFSGVK